MSDSTTPRCKRCHHPLGSHDPQCRHAKNTRPITDRFWEKVKKTDGCWEWTGYRIPFGHGRMGIGGRGNGGILTHRLSWELHYGAIPDGLEVCHKCDNPPCVRPDHLFLGTHADNMHDMAVKGRSPRGDQSGQHTHPENRPRGEYNGTSKLTNEQVIEIRRCYAIGGISHSQLARTYHVNQSTICRLLTRKKWQHIP